MAVDKNGTIKNLGLVGKTEVSGVTNVYPGGGETFCDVWDAVTLGGIVLPGVTKVDVARELKLDVQLAPGQDGATVVITGAPPAAVTITNVIGDGYAHWRDYELAIATLEVAAHARRDKRTPYAYALSHPVAKLRRVEAVFIEDISGPVQSGPGGFWTTTFRCKERRPPIRREPVAKPVTLAAAQSAANPDPKMSTAPSATRAPRP